MFDSTNIVPQSEPSESTIVDLSFLLDTIDASQPFWQELPDPYPLFIEEARKALIEGVGLSNG
jgi:hypothetical protein